MTGVQCVVLAGFTDQGYVSGVRSDALLFLAAQTAVLVATFAPTMLTASSTWFARRYQRQSQNPRRPLYSTGLCVSSKSITEHRCFSAADLYCWIGGCCCAGYSFYSE